MVLYQILSGAAEVHWVPVVEFVPHFLERLLRDLRSSVVLPRQENVIPVLQTNVLRLDIEFAGEAAVDGALEIMGNGVVGHVDGGIGEGLDEALLVPGELGA